MKKIFSLAIMALTAFVATISITACSNDDSDPISADDKVTYICDYGCSTDLWNLFDIQIVKTVGTTKTSYNFSDGKVIFKALEYDGKTTGKDKFEINENETMKIESTFTPKSNWKDYLSTKNEMLLVFTYPSNPQSILITSGWLLQIDSDKITEDDLNTWAEFLRGEVDFCNKE